MTEVSTTGMIATFAAGGISFLSPCVLPLVPGYVSCGGSIDHQPIWGWRCDPAAAGGHLELVFRAGILDRVRAPRRERDDARPAAPLVPPRTQHRRRRDRDRFWAVHAGRFTSVVASTRLPSRRGARRRTADCGLCSRHGLRFRLDTVHRPDPRGDFDGERSLGDGRKWRSTSRRLFSLPGCAFLAGGSIPRRLLARLKSISRAGRILQLLAG